jgi:two-component system sensor histidine kinase KdpD
VKEPERPNPDQILAAIQSEMARSSRGRLKVFLGMCAGVGKTFAMLEAARREQATGRDVVIGYLETHGRKETDALAQGLPMIPRRGVEYKGVKLSEFDLDATLARHPELVLVDEFAHTNAPESRHPKRWQDVMELLDAGINVFTTLNIQHIESRAEAVRQITGINIHELVRDTALENAELELVDLPPDELLARLSAGKVYLPERAATAQDQFFRPGNLSALRELALRFAAEHVGDTVRAYRQAQGVGVPWKSGQRLLVAVSSSPSSASLIRWTRRLSGELHASWVAVYVEGSKSLGDADKARLNRHLAQAKALGAEIVTTSDDDVVRAILRTAREQNATQIVVGKPTGWHWLDLPRGGSVLNRLINESGQIDIHAVRADSEAPGKQPVRLPADWNPDWRGYAAAFAVVCATTVVNILFQKWLSNQALALLYLFSVVILGLFVGRGATLFAAAATALLWDFFFTEPRYSLRISTTDDGIMFATYIVVAVAMGQLTARLRAQQDAERQREQRATALYLLTRELAESTDLAQLLAVVINQVGRSFNAEVALSLPDEENPSTPTLYFASSWDMPEKEQSVAAWAYNHRQAAGRGTDTLPSSSGLHLPLLAGERLTGVLSLLFRNPDLLLPAQRDLLDAFIRQIALVLDRERLRDTEVQAKLVAESERLSKTLLNSISHELRTPLSAITSATGTLAEHAGQFGPVQQGMVAEIQEATGRLNRLVGNLLDVTRIESGHVQVKMDWCDLNDLVRATLSAIRREFVNHPLHTQIDPAVHLARLDFVLTQQALSNLLLNAVTHTPAGTPIQLDVKREGETVLFEVADKGPGIPLDLLPRIFDKFARADNAPAGGSGLGLAIAKGFAEAQGGVITAGNRSGGGAVVSFRLPYVEPPRMNAYT